MNHWKVNCKWFIKIRLPFLNGLSLILIPLLFIIVLAGCRSPQPRATQYYVIEYPEGNKVLDSDTIVQIPLSVEILPVKVYPSFATHRIAIRENTHEIRYFLHHQWAVRPGDALTRFIYDFYTRNRLFAKVSERFWDMEPDLLFQTNIYNIEVVYANRKYFARLNLTFQLTDSKSGAILADHNSNIQIELARRNLNLFASEISKAFYDELHLFSQKVRYALINHL